MRNRMDIFKQLSLLPEPFGTTAKAQVKRTEIYLELLIDIRDQLQALNTDLADIVAVRRATP